MNCSNCNKILPNGSRFCSNCGTLLESQTKVIIENDNQVTTTQAKETEIKYQQITNAHNNSFQYYNNPKQQRYNALIKLSEYEKTSGIVWIVIGVIQCLSLVGIICGIWNIVIGTQRLKYSKELMIKPEKIYKTFEGQLTSSIIFLIINIFLGALIGVIGAVFDLYIRHYVMENKHLFTDTSNITNTEEQPDIDNISQLKSLKELLDIGILTQDEFDTKKKELLDL